MTTQNDCSRHKWLLEGGQDGTQPCPECANEAETARVLAGPARTYTADEILAAFLAGTQWAIRAVAIESDTAPEAAADTYLASR